MVSKKVETFITNFLFILVMVLIALVLIFVAVGVTWLIARALSTLFLLGF